MMDRFRFNEPLNTKSSSSKIPKIYFELFINTDGLYELWRVGEGSIRGNNIYLRHIHSTAEQVTAMYDSIITKREGYSVSQREGRGTSARFYTKDADVHLIARALSVSGTNCFWKMDG